MKTLAAEEDIYPSSDGQLLAETVAQRDAMFYLFGALRWFFKARQDVYVGMDLMMYYEEGNPRRFVAPDSFVVLGLPRGPCDKYLVWREGKAPDFVMEVAAPSTWKRDRDEKPGIYAGMGVKEYWRYDPEGAFFSPRLQGARLSGGAWRPVEARLEGGLKLFRSEALGLDLRLREDGHLRLRNPAAGEDLPSYLEALAIGNSLQALIESQKALVRSQKALLESRRALVESQEALVESRQAQTESQEARIESHAAQLESHAAQLERQQAQLAEVLERLGPMEAQVPPDRP